MLRHAEQARLRIAALRARRDRADFDEAETQSRQAVDIFAVFVQTRRQTHGIRQVQPHQRGGRRARIHVRQQADAFGADQAFQRQAVCGFGG